jgi:DNA-directed RNA polymerase
MDQLTLEQEMLDGGRSRAVAGIKRNEEAGQAYNNPYAQAVYRRYVQPLADTITEYVSEVKGGVMASGKVLLRNHDPLVLSFITVRHILGVVSSKESVTLYQLSNAVGRSVYGEAILAAFEDIKPQLYFSLVNDFERRMTKSEQHKLAVFKGTALRDGVALPHWTIQEVSAVGVLLCSMARDLGLIQTEMIANRGKTTLHVALSPEVAGLVDQISDFIAGVTPMTLPCVEAPKDWVTANDGGYHTEGMRRAAPCVVRGRPSVEDPADVPPVVLDAINALQRSPWQVNSALLDLVDRVQQHFDVGEVLAESELPKPDRPDWLADDMTKDQMTPAQLTAFSQWRGEVREWHTQKRIRGVRWGRYYEALRVARKLRGRPLYFVYQCDYRGRFYAITRGVSPQGSDLQKALLESYHGATMTDTGWRWFQIAGANRFGFDKATLDDRVKWVQERHELIMAMAEDPISHREWTEADCPFQFIAWAFEYRRLYLCRKETGCWGLTHLPLGQDGSCNGLQHFSAMVRDEVGGAATNLVPGEKQNDIYGLVAIRTAELVAADQDDGDDGIAARWRRHELSRGLVKRSVMTLPYGSTRYSCAEFILDEYMAKGCAPEFAKNEYVKAANWLSYRVWAAICDVVVKAPQAMSWLQDQVGKTIDSLQEDLSEIRWRSPTGFLVKQQYFKQEVLRINTRLAGGVRIQLRLRNDTKELDRRRHRNGIAPNFVHACDAAHLQLLVTAADKAGIPFLAMIHDDFGALAPHVETLHKLIRETFVDMYTRVDPLQDFKEYHGLKSDPPSKGNLDISQVINSTYFFC